MAPTTSDAGKLSPTSTSDEVLACYRKLLEQTHSEREAALTGLGDLRLSHKESYQLDWNTDHLEMELRKLDGLRERIDQDLHTEMRIEAELDDHIRRLEQQSLEDRIKIQRLVTLSQPVTRDITFTTRGRVRGGVGLAHHEDLTWEGWLERSLAEESDPRVVDMLRAIHGIAKSIEEAKKEYEEDLMELERQRQLREWSATKAMRKVLDRISEEGRAVRACEGNLEEDMRQYIELIHDAQMYKAQALEEHARLAELRSQLAHQAWALKDELHRAAQKTREDTIMEAERGVGDLERQVRGIEEQLCVIVEQYRAQRPIMEDRIQKLGERLEYEESKLQKEARRHRLEREGYERDVKALMAASAKAQAEEERLAASAPSPTHMDDLNELMDRLNEFNSPLSVRDNRR